MKNIFTILFFSLSITNLSLAQVFTWEWQNPKPTGADHNDAIILSATKYMLFGNGSSVAISTDAGTNWNITYVDTGFRDIYSATFVNENIGYICGTGGLLMKTTNGGQSWFAQNSNTSVTLWDVDFINADTGFVVGASGTILYTTNGGNTWTLSNYGITTLYKVHFVNDTVGYIGTASATTGRLLKTTDGGASWQNITANITGLDGTVRGIHFVDLNTGWISNSTGKIYKTTDGGATGNIVYNIGSTTTTIYEVKFVDANNGFAITTNGRVLTTTDGGNNWNLIQTAASRNLYGLGILGVQSYYSTTPVLVGGDAGTILISQDNGITWNLKTNAVTFQQLQRASFPTQNTGFVVGGSITTGNTFGDILKTTDGGENWVKLSIDPGNRTYSVFFLDENTGFIGSQGPTGVYKTTDGGNNWTQLNTNTGVASSIVYDIKFYNQNLGFAMYGSGQVARTTDGGNTWTPVSAAWGSAAGYEIFIVDSSVIYICGAGGRISKSTNAGLTFTQLPSLGTTTLYSMYFFSADTGYVVGSSGKIFYTTNGSTFSEILSPLLTTLYKINFYNDTLGWIGASGGDLYYTQNGGQTWFNSNFPVGSSQSVRDIQFAGNRMWIIGTDGMIIRGYADPTIPVELASFSASVSGNSVRLNWTTATELNNRGFEILRFNRNDNKWKAIGFVPGSGTTTEPKSYSFTDDFSLTPNLAHTLRYLLKQVDFDGSFTYSNEIEVEIINPYQFILHQNYPNPFNPNTMISWQSPVGSHQTLKVYDILGNEIVTLVDEYREAGRYKVEFDASTLPSGVYVYKLTAGSFVSSKKMIVVK
ncbi:MAG: YCF48-related protein [Ignavibacterium album]|uniref:YCF48-related protein n=1 Tax=Ignavibacterium album TaxID=591197 RepID=UPI0026F001E1|nr:YCF48-related protein [Ignavibacterium album]MCX8105765.1 YCF48-related protein [Ignavibacterium album]